MSQYRHSYKSAYRYLTVSALAISATLAATAAPVQAQQDSRARPQLAAASNVEEVIVTARKRQETLLSVPVIETAISRSQLASMQMTSSFDLAKIVPGLTVSQALNAGGLTVNLHGIGQLASATVGDSAVSLNLDGFAIGTGLAFSAGLFDLGQVEVLKGPQALFYGKGKSWRSDIAALGGSD